MKQKLKQNHIDAHKRAFFENNNININIIKDLNKCVSNDLKNNRIKKIINEKIDKLMILNNTLNSRCGDKYHDELNNQIVKFTKLLLLGHKLIID